MWTRACSITWCGCASNWTGWSTARVRLPRRGRPRPAEPQPSGSPSWESLRRAIIGQAVELLSGPGGLASFLRARQLGARLAGPSLPLDIGYAESIPAGHP